MVKFGINSKDITPRFESYAFPEPMSGCWIWTGPVTGNGYGSMSVAKWRPGNRYMSAHRISYTLYKGEIPDGAVVCHTCDMPLCVNPDHLWVGTPGDNAKDRTNKGRTANHERNGGAKLDADCVTYIRHSRERVAKLAEMFEVHKTTIYNIKSGKTWK